MIPERRQSGAALIVVLWVTTIIAAAAVAFSKSAGTDQLRLRNMTEIIRSDSVLDSAVARTAMALIDQDLSWRFGEPYAWRFDEVAVTINVSPEMQRFDLNYAPLAAFDVLLDIAEVEAADREAFLDAVAELRGEEREDDDEFAAGATFFEEPPDDETGEGEDGSEEEGVSELAFMHAREALDHIIDLVDDPQPILDNLTVYSGTSFPELALVEPDVRAALTRANVRPHESAEEGQDEGDLEDEASEESLLEEEEALEDEESSGPLIDLDELLDDQPLLSELAEALGSAPIFRLDIEAASPSGFRRRALVMLTLDRDSSGKGYHILDWQVTTRAREENS